MRCQLSSLVFVPALAVASFSPLANGSAQRTFVASLGSPANTAFNCSLAKPCRAFGDAIGVTNPKGEVVVLDSAGYGPVTITKSVSIIAPPGIYAGVSVLSGDGVTVNAPGATVVLRGLSISGQGGANGILALAAYRVRIDNCVVSGMGAVGIYHQASGGEMIVTDTIVRDNADGVGLVASNATIVLDRVRSEHNQNNGFYIAPTAVGGNASATIFDSVFAHNGAIGIWADSIGGTETAINVQRSIVSQNGGDGFYATGGASTSFVRVTLRDDSFSGNGNFGLHFVATFGFALGTVVDSTFTENDNNTGDGAARLDGGNAVLTLSRNAGQGFGCVNFGGVVTYQNNDLYLFGCSVTNAPPH